MDVDVDLIRRQLDEKEKGWLYVALSMRIRLAYGVCDRRRSRRASVHEHILVASRRHREVWLFYVARDSHGVSLRIERRWKGNQAFDKVRSVDVEQTVGERSRGREAVELTPVHDKREADARVCERMNCEYPLYATFLRRERPEELASCWNIAKEISHLNERSRRASRSACLDKFSCVHDDLRSFVRVVAAGHDGKARYRRD